MDSIYQNLKSLREDHKYTDITFHFQDGEGETAFHIDMPLPPTKEGFQFVLDFLYLGNYRHVDCDLDSLVPSNVVSMSPEEIGTRLYTLPVPCADDGASGDEDDSEEWLPDDNSEGQGSTSGGDDDSDIDFSDASEDEMMEEDGPLQSVAELEQEHVELGFQRCRDDIWRSSLVYCHAITLGIAPLRLLARDNIYRGLEKLLLYNPADLFLTFSKFVVAFFLAIFQRDRSLQLILPPLIATRYHEDVFRDHMRPILQEHPDLAMAVLECMRVPIGPR
ncbi:hypothetical protein F4780DRAFT_784457 [Xylariomycetidae sp. FL0641]|nr:hypothetical protein F4780DRAFT_784457 [Xylariomycetidae sp. FL0641]